MQENLVFGIHVAKRILENSPEDVLEIFILDARDDKRMQELVKLAKQHNLFVQTVTKKQLDNWIPDNSHQGVALRIRPKSLLTEDDLPELHEKANKTPLFLVLDGVQDPHNLGACMRSAEALGATAIVMPRDKAAKITPVVRKVACGAAEILPVVQVSNLARALQQLKDMGVWVMGASAESSQTLFQADLKGAVALVLGAEGHGLRRLTAELCDMLISIPMIGSVESLNVSVTAGIFLYEAMRNRIRK
jgi:23S rRNA (guanosine2251-2'-O)-methyltransferase